MEMCSVMIKAAVSASAQNQNKAFVLQSLYSAAFILHLIQHVSMGPVFLFFSFINSLIIARRYSVCNGFKSFFVISRRHAAGNQ